MLAVFAPCIVITTFRHRWKITGVCGGPLQSILIYVLVLIIPLITLIKFHFLNFEFCGVAEFICCNEGVVVDIVEIVIVFIWYVFSPVRGLVIRFGRRANV